MIEKTGAMDNLENSLCSGTWIWAVRPQRLFDQLRQTSQSKIARYWTTEKNGSEMALKKGVAPG